MEGENPSKTRRDVRSLGHLRQGGREAETPRDDAGPAGETYQREVRDCERQEKLVLETFPNENKKVFSALMNCISEASIQDLKRSPEGAKLFQEGDALGFFNLAIKEHEYLTPTISSAAVARLKDEFEGLRQKSEDSLLEHVNEFRRRLEVLTKARGAGIPPPYADFDLKYLLLRSLYQPTWSAWIEYREANDNLPATFAELVDALGKAEATKIFRSPSPVDPLSGTAHATSTGNKSGSTPSSTPGVCAVCGAPFCPKKPQYIRCDSCQEKHAKQRKKDRKKVKSSSKSDRPKTPKSKDKKAHATTIEGSEGDSGSDDDDEQSNHGQENVSFSCICSTRASQPADAMIYLDNCSNLNVIRDPSLAINVRQEKVATRISGSIPGTLSSRTSAELGDLGRGCHDPQFSRNLISEDAAIRAGYQVKRDSSVDDNYYLHKAGRKPLIFHANGEGTFSMTIKEFRSHFPELYAVSNSTDVDRTTMVFTKRQRERAARYNFDHAHCLNHIHHEKVIAALRKGLIVNAPYTEADVRNALIIHGPCSTCSKCKGTRHRQLGHYPEIPNAPGERLVGDLFNIMGTTFFMVSCRLIKLRCVTKLRNKGALEIARAMRDCLNVWKASEPSLRCSHGTKSRPLCIARRNSGRSTPSESSLLLPTLTRGPPNEMCAPSRSTSIQASWVSATRSMTKWLRVSSETRSHY